MFKIKWATLALVLFSFGIASPVKTATMPFFEIKTKLLDGPSRFDNVFLNLIPIGPETSYVSLAKDSGYKFGYDKQHRTITNFHAPHHKFPESISLNYGPKPQTLKLEGYHIVTYTLGYHTSGFSDAAPGEQITFNSSKFPNFVGFAVCGATTQDPGNGGSHHVPTLFWRNLSINPYPECADVQLVRAD